MSPSIIEQMINIPDYQITDSDFQDQLYDSKIMSGFSYWTIEPFENHPFNNRTLSPNWPLSSFNPGLIDTTTISLSFLQNQFCDQDINFCIDFPGTFWSKYEPAGEVTNKYHIVADGKTHLDSVAEAIVKAILKALEAFVKAVTELLSKLFNWVISLVYKLFSPLIDKIKEINLRIYNSLSKFIEVNLNAIQNITGRQSSPLPPIYFYPSDYPLSIELRATGVMLGVAAFWLGLSALLLLCIKVIGTVTRPFIPISILAAGIILAILTGIFVYQDFQNARQYKIPEGETPDQSLYYWSIQVETWLSGFGVPLIVAKFIFFIATLVASLVGGIGSLGGWSLLATFASLIVSWIRVTYHPTGLFLVFLDFEAFKLAIAAFILLPDF